MGNTIVSYQKIFKWILLPFISLLIIFGMWTNSVCSAANSTGLPDSDKGNYTFDEANQKITITNNISLNNTWEVPKEIKEIDLGNHEITVPEGTSVGVAVYAAENESLKIHNGSIVINKPSGDSERYAALWADNISNLTLEKLNLTLTPESTNKSAYGLFLSGKTTVNIGSASDENSKVQITGPYGAAFIFDKTKVESKPTLTDETDKAIILNLNNGYIKGTSAFGLSSNANDSGSSEININGGTVESTNDCAIYIPGKNHSCTISGGTITGKTGIGIKGGTLNISGGTIEGTSEVVSNPNLTDNGMDPTGSALVIANGNSNQYGNIKINITGGEFTSKKGNCIQQYGGPENNKITTSLLNSIEISGGSFICETSTKDPITALTLSTNSTASGFISGGTFSKKINKNDENNPFSSNEIYELEVTGNPNEYSYFTSLDNAQKYIKENLTKAKNGTLKKLDESGTVEPLFKYWGLANPLTSDVVITNNDTKSPVNRTLLIPDDKKNTLIFPNDESDLSKYNYKVAVGNQVKNEDIPFEIEFSKENSSTDNTKLNAEITWKTLPSPPASGTTYKIYTYYSTSKLNIDDTTLTTSEKPTFNIIYDTTPTSNLIVSNTVENSDNESSSQAFIYSLELVSDKTLPLSLSYTYNTQGEGEGSISIKKENNVYKGEFTLTGTQTISIQNIPVGTEYKIKQTPVEGFTTNPNDYTVSGTISNTTENKATFINTYSSQNPSNSNGTLTITKVVKGNTTEDNESFKLTIKLVKNNAQDMSITILTGLEYEYNDSNEKHILELNNDSSGEIDIKGGQSVTISNIPEGTTYTVTEEGSGNYTSEITNNTGTISKNEDSKVKVTNTYNTSPTKETGTLTISKKVESDSGVTAPSIDSFEFKVNLKPKSGTELTGITKRLPGKEENTKVNFETGKDSQPPILKNGESVVYYGIPAGTEYTITEVSKADYECISSSSGSVTGTIQGNAQKEEAFVNKYSAPKSVPTGTLTISEQFKGNNNPEEFTYTLKLTDSKGSELKDSYPYHIISSTETETVSLISNIKKLTQKIANLFVSEEEPLIIKSGESVDLAPNSKIIIYGLPDGTRFEVSQTSLNNIVANANTYKGIVSTEDIAEAPFVNDDATTGPTGNIVFTAPDSSGGISSFDFKITLKDEEENLNKILYTVGDNTNAQPVVFNSDGSFNITSVEAGQKVTILNVPTGTLFTIVDDTPGNDVKYINPFNEVIGEVSPNNFELVFKSEVESEKKVGSLEITKTVTGTNPPENDSFVFNVDFGVSNAKSSLPYIGQGGINSGFLDLNEDGIGTINLSNGEKITIPNLNDGTSYKITEDSVENYISTPSNDSGTITTDVITQAGFENKFTGPTTTVGTSEGSIKIQKIVKGESSPEEPQNYTFNMTLRGEDLADAYAFDGTETTFEAISEDEENNSKTYQFQISGNTNQTLSGLPVGTKFSIEEETSDDYVTTYQVNNETTSNLNATGVIEREETEVDITNTYLTFDSTPEYSDIELVKEVVSEPDTPETYDFEISLTDGTNKINDTFKTEEGNDVEFTDGIAKVSITGAGSIKILQVPIGYTYTFKETSKGNYTAFYGSSNDQQIQGIVTASSDNTGVITNTYKTTVIPSEDPQADLTISKTVKNAPEHTPDFTFNIRMQDNRGNPISESFQDVNGNNIEFSRGLASCKIAAGESYTIKNIPVGYKYTVTEASIENYSPSYSVDGASSEEGAGTIKSGGSQVDVVNEYSLTPSNNSTDLVLEKVVENGPKTDETYTFAVTLADDKEIPVTNTFNTSTSEDITFKSGTAEIEIVGAGSYTIKNIPIGYTYTIRETSTGDYKPDYGSTGAIQLAGQITANLPKQTIKNIYSKNSNENGNGNNDTPGPDIAITKTQAKNDAETSSETSVTVKKEDTITYSIKVTNNEKNPVKDLEIVDKIPEGLTVNEKDIENKGVLENGTITWEIPTVETEETVSFTATVSDEKAKQWKNKAQVLDASKTDKPTIVESNVVTASIPSAQEELSDTDGTLKISKSQNLNGGTYQSTPLVKISSGNTIGYNVTVENLSNTAVTNVIVQDILPAELSLKDNPDDATEAEDESGRTALVWNIEEIPAGEKETLEVITTVGTLNTAASAVNLENTATVTDYKQMEEGAQALASNTVLATSAETIPESDGNNTDNNSDNSNSGTDKNNSSGESGNNNTGNTNNSGSTKDPSSSDNSDTGSSSQTKPSTSSGSSGSTTTPSIVSPGTSSNSGTSNTSGNSGTSGTSSTGKSTSSGTSSGSTPSTGTGSSVITVPASTTSTTTTPNTGIESHLILWIGLAAAALVVMSISLAISSKKKN